MGAMAEVALERELALTEARDLYESAYGAYQEVLDRYPPADRTLPQMDEISRAEGRCTIAKLQYENAKSQRYKL